MPSNILENVMINPAVVADFAVAREVQHLAPTDRGISNKRHTLSYNCLHTHFGLPLGTPFGWLNNYDRLKTC